MKVSAYLVLAVYFAIAAMGGSTICAALAVVWSYMAGRESMR